MSRPSRFWFKTVACSSRLYTILHRYDHLSNLHNLWTGSCQSSIYGYRKKPCQYISVVCRAGTSNGSVVAAAGEKEKEEEDATTFIRSSLSPQVEPI